MIVEILTGATILLLIGKTIILWRHIHVLRSRILKYMEEEKKSKKEVVVALKKAKTFEEIVEFHENATIEDLYEKSKQLRHAISVAEIAAIELKSTKKNVFYSFSAN